MQRLISLYPRGWPGIGLILLRFAVGTGLVLHNPIVLLELPSGVAYFTTGIVVLSLIGGLLSSWMALACCMAATFGLSDLNPGTTTLPVLVFGLCSGALLMVGPGAYSMDAILFGRRVIRIPD